MLNHEKCSEKKTVGIIGGMGPAATAMLFQKLIDYRAHKPYAQQIITASLVNAPEHGDGDHHKKQFVAQLSDQGHQCVHKRGADAL